MASKTSPAVLLATVIIAATIGSSCDGTQPSRGSTTMTIQDWTLEEMEGEVERYTLVNPPKSDDSPDKLTNIVVLSGFLEAGNFWSDLDKETATFATARRDKIAWYLATLPGARYADLADRVRLIKTERRGDWLCAVAWGCYPKGYVVGIIDVSGDRASGVCEMLRRNDRFCAVAVREPFRERGEPF